MGKAFSPADAQDEEPTLDVDDEVIKTCLFPFIEKLTRTNFVFTIGCISFLCSTYVIDRNLKRNVTSQQFFMSQIQTCFEIKPHSSFFLFWRTNHQIGLLKLLHQVIY